MPSRLSLVLALTGCTYLGPGSLDRDGDGVLDDVDCDFTSPAAAERSTWIDAYVDEDRDGFGTGTPVERCEEPGDGFVLEAGDCDDTNPDIRPGVSERCDTVDIDDDCDGLIDDQDEAPIGALAMLPDVDADGVGDTNGLASAEVRCAAEALHVLYAGGPLDCDDAEPTAFPGNDEVLCDTIDNDCDGTVDEIDSAEGFGVAYADLDADLYPDSLVPLVDCVGVAGLVAADDVPGDLSTSLDCDPTNADIHPDAIEVPYNAIDEDCDGGDLVDVDQDGFDYLDDCDDDDPDVNPLATDLPYDGVDANCDLAEEYDLDGDGFDGGPTGADCNDTDAAISPSASDDPGDGVDSDCDGFEVVECYTDADADGFGADAIVLHDLDACPTGEVAVPGDCDDLDGSRMPGALEYCDGVDNDCDGLEATSVVSLRDAAGVWTNAVGFDVDAPDAVEIAICGELDDGYGAPIGVNIDLVHVSDRSVWIHGSDLLDDAGVEPLGPGEPVVEGLVDPAFYGNPCHVQITGLELHGADTLIDVDCDNSEAQLDLEDLEIWGVDADPAIDAAEFEGEVRWVDSQVSGGAGVMLQSASRADIDNVEIAGFAGTALHLRDASVSGLELRDATTPVPAMLIDGDVGIIDSRISDLVTPGVLVEVHSSGSLALLDVDANGLDGAVVVLVSGSLSMAGCLFRQNTASISPIQVVGSALVTVVNSDLSDNVGQSVGVVEAGGGVVLVQESVFRNNEALGGNGGALRGAGSEIIVFGSEFYDNVAGDGGAIYATSSDLTLRGTNVFENNSASSRGGAIFSAGGVLDGVSGFIDASHNTAADGGFLYSTGTVGLTQLATADNTAPDVTALAGSFAVGWWQREGYGQMLQTGGSLTGAVIENLCQLAYGYGLPAGEILAGVNSYSLPTQYTGSSQCPMYGYGDPLAYGGGLYSQDVYGELSCSATDCVCVTGCAYGSGGGVL